MVNYICFRFDTYVMSSAEDLNDTIIVVGGMFLILFVNFLLLHVLNEIMLLFCVFSTLFKWNAMVMRWAILTFLWISCWNIKLVNSELAKSCT